MLKDDTQHQNFHIKWRYNSSAQCHSSHETLHSTTHFSTQRPVTKLIHTCNAKIVLNGALLLLSAKAFTKSGA